MRKERNQAFEILRIISILCILLSHYCYHGGFAFGGGIPKYNELLLRCCLLGNLGVDVFIMISGYYLISSDSKIKYRKITQLLLEGMFYSILIYLTIGVGLYRDFSITGFIKACIPFTTNEWWFFTGYIIILALSPFINRMLNSLTKKEYILYLAIMTIIFTLIPTIFTYTPGGSTFTRFLFVYSVGAFIKLFPNKHYTKKNGIRCIMISLGTMILSSAVVVYLPQLGVFITDWSRFYQQWSIPVLVASSGLIIIAMNTNIIGQNKFILSLAGSTLGIYMFSDHELTRKFLWIDLLKNSNFGDSPYLIIHLILSVIFVLILGWIIDLIRKNSVEKISNIIVDILDDKIFKRVVCKKMGEE